MGYRAGFFEEQVSGAGEPGPGMTRRKAAGRKRRGTVAAVSGLLAEDRVAADYKARGYHTLARRWRGKAGEVDLICQRGDCVIFVEVKSASTHAIAGQRLFRRQMDRICLAACEFCGDRPDGLLSEMRFDAALVDGAGRIEVIENAFGG